jgi:hypothetical protein
MSQIRYPAAQRGADQWKLCMLIEFALIETAR